MMPQSTAPESRSVRLSSGHLGLADWLEFSWFYPDGFKKDQILETNRAWIIIGNGIAYKFLKSGDRNGEPAKERWRRSVEELADNLPLAEPVYLGLRCLQEEDGDLVWESRARSVRGELARMPRNTHDVALVLRKLDRHERLDSLVEKNEKITSSLLAKVAAALARFHRTPSLSVREGQTAATDQFLTLTERRHLDPLRNLLTFSRPLLDRIYTRGMEEALDFLSGTFRDSGDEFRERNEGGLIIDCHRNVSARNIYFLRDNWERKHIPVVLGRQAQHLGIRTDDCLYDIASLSVELELSDRELSERFEDSYFTNHPAAYSARVFQFFKVAVCAARLQSLLSGGLFSSSNPMEAASELFGLLMRLIFGLNRPACVVLLGEDALSGHLPEVTAEVLGAELRDEDTALPDYLHYTVSDDFLRLRTLTQCRAALSEGKLLLLTWKKFCRLSALDFEQLLADIPCFKAILVSPDGGIKNEPQLAESKCVHQLNSLSLDFNLIDRVFLTLRDLRLQQLTLLSE